MQKILAVSATQLIAPESNKFSGIFADSDDETETKLDPLDDRIIYQYQERYTSSIRDLREFMNNPDFITSSGDSTTNVVDRYSMINNKVCSKSYLIPDEKLAKMFKHIDYCRRKNATLMLYEKQLEYSGIMLDFDILQKQNKSMIDPSLFYSVSMGVITLLKKYINLFKPDTPYVNNTFDIHIAFIKKPEVRFDTEKKYYKDGFHILIPGVKVTREVKRFLIKKCIEEDIFQDLFMDVQPADNTTYMDFLDLNSAHVPVFFLGSSTKFNTPAYKLITIKKATFSTTEIETDLIRTVSVTDDISVFDPNNLNQLTSPVVLCHELSLNWEVDKKHNGIITKKKYEIKEKYTTDVNSLKGKSTEEVKEEEYGELSLLHIHDPDADYIQSLLNTLDSSRYTDFNLWFQVLCMLAHTSKSYKSLAENFSMKSLEKYNAMDFEHHWQSATANKKNALSIGSLHYWAKMDNPVKYEEVRKLSVYTMVYTRVYDPQLEGSLQHYDIAKILFKSLRHKYVFDPSNGGNWYEFILQEDPQKSGEIYKWRTYNKTPSSIKIYTSEILPALFTKVFEKINGVIEGLDGGEMTKYHNMVKANLKITCRKLRDSGFKLGIGKECEQVFEKINFADSLDKDPEILGVGNGILKLGTDVQFITGYHSYSVSQSTPVDYIGFDPYAPITKKLLIAIRNLFPDDEPDTFNFIMHYLASALDGKKKESLLLLLVGAGSNGKSFIVELFKETLGSNYAVKMPLSFLTSRQKNSESATPALMMLVNARFAYYSETEKSETLHLAKVKEITGQETLGGRKNFGDYQTFKPTCHHLVTSNYDFDVNGNDHGTWRRLKRVSMKIKFCKENVDSYDPDNPYERIADSSMGTKWPDDPEVRSAFLSILCYYYESLQTNFNGVVENVHHPNVTKETEAFRDRQDKINNFINTKFVKTVDNEISIPISTVIAKYTKWYDGLYPDDKDYKKSLGFQFENSKLGKIISKTKLGIFIYGYRILEQGETLEEGEMFFMDVYTESKKFKSMDIKSETSEEYYNRICLDFDIIQKQKLEIHKQEVRKFNLRKIELRKLERKEINPVIKKNNVELSVADVKEYDKSGFLKKTSDLNDVKEMVGDNSSESESESDSDSETETDSKTDS